MNIVKVNNLILGDGIPKICVPVIAHTYDELKRSLKTVRESHYDMVEFRADFYFEDDRPALEAVRETVGEKPILYTIRTKEEGGEIEISDDGYEARNIEAAAYADLIDVQVDRLHAEGDNLQLHSHLISRLHGAGTKVVGSWHDFEHTPDHEFLVEKMLQMQKEGCDITKISVMPNSRKDVMELIIASLEMLEGGADRPFITMSMGNLGRITRAGCAFTGSCVSFGTAGRMSAPGQISSDVLSGMMKVLSI